MKKSWFIFFILIFLFSGVSAAISNVHTEPLYPNLNSSNIIVYAEISSNGSTINYALLHYQMDYLPNVFLTGLFVDGHAQMYLIPKDNSVVSYQIEAVDALGNVENSTLFTFTYDGTAPEISITGDNSLAIEINSTYDELGATASDSIYGDLTSNISVSGIVDTSLLGEYIITYTVSDLAGNIATATRTVHVIEPIPVIVNNNAGGRADSYSSSGGSRNKAANNETGSQETENPEEQFQNSGTSSKAGITGKSIVDIIGENKGISIFIGILAVGGVVGYYLIKKEIKRKLYGK